jgi:hypothetical protein
MSGIRDQDKIDEVRKRLYERGGASNVTHSHALHDTHIETRTSWQVPPKPLQQGASQVPRPSLVSNQTHEHLVESPEQISNVDDLMGSVKRKKGYRIKILYAGLSFFALAVLLSSGFLLFGRNSISGENISIVATGPFTVGGGAELQMQVGITNDNAVPIESATLIVEYPSGTQSSTEKGKDLFTDRLPLQTIKQGETVNVPMKALVFGEENDEKIVKVSVEYRVQGSNATFFKEAEPLRFKISSSPVVFSADTVKKISSGQNTDVVLSVKSNSPTPITEILVKAEYPTGFDYSKANPAPSYGENMWLIKNLEPGKEQKITVTGVVIGKETDKNAINFTVGVPNERDPQSLASIFAKTQTEFQIEQPFLNVLVKIDSSSEKEVAVEPGKRSNVTIELTNSLSDTLNDIVVEVKLGGNAVQIYSVGPSSGYFDTSKNTILWDVANNPDLGQANPGDTKRLSFSIDASASVNRTPQVDISVNARARRVSENRVSEELVGTAERTIKVVSVPKIIGVTNHDNGIFKDAGPVPPVADTATTYTVSFVVENGSNGITDAIVTASLPAYVSWMNITEGGGKVTYNPTNRTIEWAAGDIDANGETYTSFQVSLLPRALQVGTIPTLVSEQRIKATDKFTGTVVRATNPPITTKLPSESGENDESGRVRATGSN